MWLFVHEAVNINVIEWSREDFPADSRPFAQEISFLDQNEIPTNDVNKIVSFSLNLGWFDIFKDQDSLKRDL